MSEDLRDPDLSRLIAPKQVVTARGGVEYVEVGSGPSVVCLHGAMGGYDQSLLLAQTVGDTGYRYLCLSRPGYLGTSISGGASAAEQADLVAAFLDALNIPAAGVMAVSGGGPCAIQFGLRHADRCRGLALFSTCATAVDMKIPLAFKITLRLARWRWFAEKLQQKASGNLEESARRSVRDPEILARTMADPEAWPLFSRMMQGTWEHLPRRIAGTMNDIEVSRRASFPLEELRLPVLAVHGTDDPLLPFERHGKVFGDRLPNAELLPIESGEHVAIFTHRKLIRPKVASFMEGNFLG